MVLNAYGLVILVAVVLEYGLEVLASTLNVRALDPRVPAPFREIYDPEKYRRSQDYTRTRIRFGLVVSSARLIVLLLFWYLGGFAVLDRAVRGLGFGPIPTGVSFIAALALGAALLGLPARWYATFVIEERFGFNRTTRRTFWTDQVKALLLSAALGVPVLAVVVALFLRAGPWAWVYCWAVVTAFLVVVQFVAPTWLMPLFNRFEPLAEGELRDKIEAYARAVGFPLRGLFVVDGSRRSSKANAFFTGFGRNKRIALFDTLVRSHRTDEIVAVVAHEVGHYKKGHVVQGLLVAVAHAGVVFALLGAFLRSDGLYEAFGIEQRSVHAGLVFFGLLYTPVEVVLAFVLHAWSRRHEYEADRFAAETTGRWQDLASALRKLAADTLTNLTPHPFYVAMHHSHPPLLRRIEILRRHGGGGSG